MLDTKARELKGTAVGGSRTLSVGLSARAWVPELPCRHSKTGVQGGGELITGETKSELSQPCQETVVRQVPL